MSQICGSDIDSRHDGIAVILIPFFTIQNNSRGLQRSAASSTRLSCVTIRMVQRLSDRLAKNPQDLDGWQRLMRARMVLGQADAAAQAYRDGAKALAGSQPDQAALRRSAAELGVPGI